jgi:glutathione S-transferase
VQSAKDRYYSEIKRVTGVLNGHLEKQEKGIGGPWLVGGRYSYADLALFSWQNMMMTTMKDVVDLSEFTEVTAWIEKMRERPAIKEVLVEPSSH